MSEGVDGPKVQKQYNPDMHPGGSAVYSSSITQLEKVKLSEDLTPTLTSMKTYRDIHLAYYMQQVFRFGLLP